MAMRLAILILLSLCLPLKAQLAPSKAAFTAALLKPTAGASKASFSDNFNRADSDSLGANWTEIAGDIDIVSNEASAPIDFTFNEKAAVYSATPCTTVEQYVKVTLSANNGIGVRPGAVFRYTDGSSPFYEIRCQLAGAASSIYWMRLASPGGAETQVGVDVTQTLDAGVVVGITCSGTGNSTVIRVWKNPTANAPTTAALWDGAGPAVTFTDDPAAAVDTGNYLGIGGIWTTALFWDDFYGGDIP